MVGESLDPESGTEFELEFARVCSLSEFGSEFGARVWSQSLGRHPKPNPEMGWVRLIYDMSTHISLSNACVRNTRFLSIVLFATDRPESVWTFLNSSENTSHQKRAVFGSNRCSKNPVAFFGDGVPTPQRVLATGLVSRDVQEKHSLPPLKSLLKPLVRTSRGLEKSSPE